MQDVRDKVAIVTGGGSGMGRIIARRLVERGARVALFDVNEAGMAETAGKSDRMTAFHCDISRREVVDEVVNEGAGILSVHERRVDQVDAQDAEGVLLAAVRAVEHPHVDRDPAGLAAGAVLELSGLPEFASFYAFIALAFAYFFYMRRTWRIQRFLGRDFIYNDFDQGEGD